MKHIKINSRLLFGGIILCLAILSACKESIQELPKTSDQQVIADYIVNSKDCSEFGKIAKSAGLEPLLSIRGPYTVFLPTNDAISAYYKKIGITSYTELDTTAQKKLVLNHVIGSEIYTGDMLIGALSDKNALGDALVTEFLGTDIILNKTSKIVKRDIIASNGVVHKVDVVIEPIVKDIYSILLDNPSYSIFAAGLNASGLKDTLQLIEFPYGKTTARTRFTIFAVADTTYNRFGIFSITDLINKYTNRPDSVTFLQNGFFRYMEYHCLANSYFLSDFDQKSVLYPTLTFDNNVLIEVTDDYKINFDKVTKLYTHIYVEQSDIPAKNGAIHTVDNLFAVTMPPPTEIVWEVTDFFDVKQDECFGRHYKKWYDGQNSFQYVKFGGNFLQYYFKDPAKSRPNLNWDCWNMYGFWWIEVTTPKIMKGNYSLSGFIWAGNADFAAYVDDELVTTVKSSIQSGDLVKLCDVNWTTTTQHKVKLVALSYGALFYDRLVFTPNN